MPCAEHEVWCLEVVMGVKLGSNPKHELHDKATNE